MRLVLLVLLFFNYAFAVKDILFKPITSSNDYVTRRVLFKSQTENYPELKSSKISQDEYNNFVYSTHFRVIFGKDYNETDKANTILNIAENVWNKEIEGFGFKAPINSDKYYIDIYIGNKDAYNKATSSYATISSSYAGFAESYQSDNTPYFIISPTIDINLLKVTIAHEFFHTVQFAYDFYDVNDDIWNKNVWFLEASAVMMEDEVYDDINDYINYISDYFRHTYNSLEESDGSIEYGKVVFAKFLREKFGMDFIKYILSSYTQNETILQDIQKSFKAFGTTFDTAFSIYATWLYDTTKFEEGLSYPYVPLDNFSEKLPIEYYGVEFIGFDDKDRYLYGSNAHYLQETFAGVKNIVDDINSAGLILVNKSPNDTLYAKILEDNHFENFTLKKGWNLLGNSFDIELNLETLLQNDEIAWIFENDRYYGFSKNSTYENKIKELGYDTDNPNVKKGKGFWIYTLQDTNITLSPLALSQKNIDQGRWNLISFSSTFNPQYFDDNISIIWHYDNGWKYYSKEYNLSIDKIQNIVPTKGYFTLYRKP